MSDFAETTDVPIRDRSLVLYDVLEEIALLKVGGVEPAEVERLVEEFHRLRTEL
jgi:hypothetical protein